MNNLRQAAQAALEALEQTHKGHWPDDAPEVIAALRAALAEPQPEPVAQSRTIREIICYIRENDLGSIGDEWIAALQAPQAQQPLTDSEINRLMHTVPGFMGTHWIMKFARVVEAAHGIK